MAEIEELRKFSRLEKIERWDVAYYSRLQFECLSEGITEEEFAPYFRFVRVLAGALETAESVF